MVIFWQFLLFKKHPLIIWGLICIGNKKDSTFDLVKDWFLLTYSNFPKFEPKYKIVFQIYNSKTNQSCKLKVREFIDVDLMKRIIYTNLACQISFYIK